MNYTYCPSRSSSLFSSAVKTNYYIKYALKTIKLTVNYEACYSFAFIRNKTKYFVSDILYKNIFIHSILCIENQYIIAEDIGFIFNKIFLKENYGEFQKNVVYYRNRDAANFLLLWIIFEFEN